MRDGKQTWWIVLRALAGLFALYFSMMVLVIVYGQVVRGVTPLYIIYCCAFSCAAILCWSFMLAGDTPAMRHRLRYVCAWALGLGATAFVSGFFLGPMIARSLQAPLFGFMLAPIGFSSGCVIGAAHAHLRLASAAARNNV